MKRIVFTSNEAAANQSGAMETDTISKNGASSKSHTSRGNFYKMICFALAGMALCMNLSAQSEWTYKNGQARQDGRIVRPAQVRVALSGNSAALQQYNSGRTLYTVGGIVMIPGALAIGGGLGILLGTNLGGYVYDANKASINTTCGILIGVGAVGLTASFLISNSGAKKIKNAIDMHNSSLRRDVSYQVKFGVTPSGGVGLTMLF